MKSGSRDNNKKGVKNRDSSLDEYKKKSAERLKKFREASPFGVPEWEFVEEDSSQEEIEELDYIPPATPFYGVPPQFGPIIPPPPFVPPFAGPPLPKEDPQYEEIPEETSQKNISVAEKMAAIENDKRVVQMREEGEKLAEKIISSDNSEHFFASVLRFSITVVILMVFLAGGFLLVKYFYDQINKTEEESGVVSPAKSSTEGWLLSFTKADEIVRKFYSSMGDLEYVGKFRDLSVRGVINREGTGKEEFFCVKKPEATFIKIGVGKASECYLVDEDSGKTGVYALEDGNVAGSKKELDNSEALRIRMLVDSDDELFRKIFNVGNPSGRNVGSGIKYLGDGVFDNRNCEILQTSDSRGGVRTYYFDTETSMLAGWVASIGDNTYKCVFGNYISSGKNHKVPESKKVYVNDRLYAEINADFAARNRGVMFPQ